jgi:hypothetical protein
LFFKNEDANTIEANKPYIVKWTDGEANNVTNPVFNSVTIAGGGANSVTSVDGAVSFVGTYGNLNFTEGNSDNSKLFLGSSNTLYWPQAGASIGAQRAFFQLHDITAGDPKQPGTVRSFVLSFGDNEDTGIRSLTSDASSIGEGSGYYSLDGRKLGSKPTKSGVYVKDGKKIVVK